MPSVFCHECERTGEGQTTGNSGQFRCPECNSEFVEVQDEGSAPLGSHGARTQQRQHAPPRPASPAPQQAARPPGMQSRRHMWGSAAASAMPNATTSQRHRIRLPNGSEVDIDFTTHVFPAGAELPPELARRLPRGAGPMGAHDGDVMMMVDPGTLPVSGPSLLAALLGGLAGGGMMPGQGNEYNAADFGMGQSLEQLLAHLAEMHQPRQQPTSAAARAALPRLEVCAAASPAGPRSATISSAATTSPVANPAQTAAKKATAETEKSAEQPEEQLKSAANDDTTSEAVAEIRTAEYGVSHGEETSPQRFASCQPGDTCSVCRDEFKEGQEVVQLPCKHCFDEGCIMPWLEMHSTCPICRHQLPLEEERPMQAEARPPRPSTADRQQELPSRHGHSPRAHHRRQRSDPGRRSSSIGVPEAAPNAARNNGSGDGSTIANILARMLSGVLPQHQRPQQQHHQQRGYTPTPAVRRQQEALLREAEGVSVQHEAQRRQIRSLVMELQRLQQLRGHQMPGSEEPYQEQLERLRQLSRDVQGEFDTVDGIISRGTRRLTDLQSQASNLRMQLLAMRQHQQQPPARNEAPANMELPPDQAALQNVSHHLQTCEDSMALASTQLNNCRATRQGLQLNLRLLNSHISVFESTDTERSRHEPHATQLSQSESEDPQGLSFAERAEQEVRRAMLAAAATVAEEQATATRADSGNSSGSGQVRPASGPADGDSGSTDGDRRVRPRTDQALRRALETEDAAVTAPMAAFSMGRSVGPASLQSARHGDTPSAAQYLAGDVSSEQRARSSLERPSVASMSEGEAAPGGAEAPATPTATAAHPATPRDASQGFSLPLHAVPSVVGRLFGGLRGMLGGRR
mmetsp:Transcript_1055/g.3222  ORF Transcript_1055/g.3222 Transcript_1055/m.3222 type:complete len:862 (-) Transcript_1055:479-3064(-)